MDFIAAGIGSAIGGPAGGALASAGSSAVSGAVSHLVSSVVGVFDPGKARDAQREARAEMWYQIAIKGSQYAGQHVLGGMTLVYTVKEKGYYSDRWGKLKNENPRIAQLAQQLGGLGIPDNPTQAEIQQMSQEIDAYNNQDLTGLSSTSLGQAILDSQKPTITLTPSGLPGTAPVNPLSPQVYQHAQPLPTMVTTAQAPVTHTWLYVLVGIVLLVLIIFAAKEWK